MKDWMEVNIRSVNKDGKTERIIRGKIKGIDPIDFLFYIGKKFPNLKRLEICAEIGEGNDEDDKCN